MMVIVNSSTAEAVARTFGVTMLCTAAKVAPSAMGLMNDPILRNSNDGVRCGAVTAAMLKGMLSRQAISGTVAYACKPWRASRSVIHPPNSAPQAADAAADSQNRAQ